jgi:hypothetical protein
MIKVRMGLFNSGNVTSDTVTYWLLLVEFQVKRRVKPPPKEKSEEKKEREHFEEREELDFQFDEELDGPVPSGRHNTFTDW